MPFAAVLDASVLFTVSLCDTLLRLAEHDLYQPLWSERILNEVHHSVTRKEGVSLVARRIAAMRRRFPEAMVPPSLQEEESRRQDIPS